MLLVRQQEGHPACEELNVAGAVVRLVPGANYMCCPASATATRWCFASVKSILVLPF